MGATMGKSGNFLDQSTLHVVMLGLDSAGKTTALYRLKLDQYLNTVPTIGFNCEKVQGTVGKAKGVQFLVWDVGGQEKLRPLWRSYTRCTDGILFVVDSVDIERMEEAKMELMRTTKSPDNQGVPVLIVANKQDLPGARDPKELEKLLGLHELLSFTTYNSTLFGVSSASTSNIVVSSDNSNIYEQQSTLTPISAHSKQFCTTTNVPSNVKSLPRSTSIHNKSNDIESHHSYNKKLTQSQSQTQELTANSTLDNDLQQFSAATTPTTATSASSNQSFLKKFTSQTDQTTHISYKGWYIQPACAITGEGLQEGLEALYDMIIKRRKLNKMCKRKR